MAAAARNILRSITRTAIAEHRNLTMAAVARDILRTITRTAIGVGIGLSILDSSLYTVDIGESAVICDRFRGVLEKPDGVGMHFKIPWVQKAYFFDTRVRSHYVTSTCDSKDLQTVDLSLELLFRPETSRLPTIFKTLGTEYDEKVLPSIGDEVLRNVVAQFSADQLVTERRQVSTLIREGLMERAKEFGIIIHYAAIIELSYNGVVLGGGTVEH